MNSIYMNQTTIALYCINTARTKLFQLDKDFNLLLASDERLQVCQKVINQLDKNCDSYVDENHQTWCHLGLGEMDNVEGNFLLLLPEISEESGLQELNKLLTRMLNQLLEARRLPKTRDYEFLIETAMSIIGKLSLKNVLQEMIDGATAVLKSERGSLMLLNDNDELEMIVAKGIPEDVIPTIRVKKGEGIAGEVAETGEAILISDIEHHEKFGRKSTDQFNTTSLLSVPLKIQERVLGVFNINNRTDGRTYNQADRQLLMALAGQASIAIENARHFEELKEKQAALDDQIEAYSNLYEEQYALFEITKVFRSSYDNPEESIGRMMRVSVDTIGARVGLLISRDKDREKERYRYTYMQGFKQDEFQPNSLEGEDHLIAEIVEKKTSLIINDFQSGIRVQPDVTYKAEVIQEDGFLKELSALIEGGLENAVILPLHDYDNNSSLGALIFANRVSGEDFTEHIRNLLDILTGQIAATISQHKLLSQYILKKNMEKELDVAKAIQRKLLPKSRPELKNVDISALNIPAKHVSGDYYDYLNHGNNYDKIGMVIADVAGKGIPAALIMSMTRAILRTQVNDNTTPATILNQSNTFLNEDIESNRYVTMFYAVLDTRTFDCTFAKAGHNPPIWYHAADKSVEYLEVEGFPLGMFEFSQYEDHHISMKPMDKLVFYTDGITEAMNPNQDEYSLARLCTFIQDFHEFDSRSLIERLMMDVDEFTEGAPQHDDLTMIILSISSFELTKVEIESNRGAVVTFTEKFIAEMEEKSIEGMDHFEVTMILDELLINAAEHGNKFDTEKKVHIEYAILPYKVELIITDEGNGFDFEATFKEKEKITLYHKRGRGIQIVKQLVDKLEYSNHGRTCRMVKYLK